MMTSWILMHGIDPDMLGFLPIMWDENDPRPAKEQANENYSHGGGWRPMAEWSFDKDTMEIQYPGDPAYKPIAMTQLRDEAIIVYRHAWVCILQEDGTFEVSRMD